MQDSGWMEVSKFFKRKINEADEATKKMIVALNNEFFDVHFSYIGLSYQEAEKQGDLLSKEESQRKIRNAQARIRWEKKQEECVIINQV